MFQVVGVIQIFGFFFVLVVVDVMFKGGRVILVYYDLVERGNFVVVIWGLVLEVNLLMKMGLVVVNEFVMGGEIVSYYIVFNLFENVLVVLLVEYIEKVVCFCI